ncbi:MAG: hypothetical protein AAF222_04110 [Pseudomonadota bacterium]
MLLAGGALAACSTIQPQSRDAPSQLLLADGTMISGADGWCIDQATTQTSAETTVIVLGSCAALAGDLFQPQPNVPGVVTISIEAEAGEVPGSEALEAFFVSEAGRAVLARNGEADSVSIITTRHEDGLLYLHASDDSVGPNASNDIWRALFDLGGRFVAVSFYSRDSDAIEPEDGLATLLAQVQELQAANQG